MKNRVGSPSAIKKQVHIPIGYNTSLVPKKKGGSVYKPFNLLQTASLVQAPRPCRHSLIPEITAQANRLQNEVLNTSKMVLSQEKSLKLLKNLENQCQQAESQLSEQFKLKQEMLKSQWSRILEEAALRNDRSLEKFTTAAMQNYSEVSNQLKESE